MGLASRTAHAGSVIGGDGDGGGPAGASGMEHVAVDVEYRPSGQNWVVPRTSAEIGSAPPYEIDCASEECIAWVRGLGGVPTGRNSTVGITVRSDADRVAVVQSIRIVERVPLRPVGGTNVALCEGADAVDGRRLRVDLDDPEPEVVYVRDDGTEEDDYRFRLRRGEVELFVLDVDARRGTYQWKAEVVVNVGDNTKTFAVTNDGRPFLTAAPAPGVLYVAGPREGGPLTVCEVMCDVR